MDYNFIKKIFIRFKKDNIKQFLARIGLHVITIYPKIKLTLFIASLKRKNKPKRWFVREINRSKMLLDINDKGISRHLLYKGIREPRSTKFMESFVKKGDICIDIGANIGYYALLESRLVGNEGRVYAIEPVMSNFKLLKKNIELNDYNNLITYPLAIGSRNGLGYINLSSSSNLHSMVCKDLVSNNQIEQVEVMRLDKFLEDKPYPTFIRMDVEGYEEEIIKGMDNFLRTNKPLRIFIELHSFMLEDGGANLLKILDKRGFKIKALFNERHGLITKESKIITFLYDFFLKRLGVLNSKFENYNLPIDVFLKNIQNLKRNSFEIFLERK